MTITEKARSMTTKELKSLAKELHCSMYVTHCFSSRDVLMYNACLKELERRGYNAVEQKTLVFEPAE